RRRGADRGPEERTAGGGGPRRVRRRAQDPPWLLRALQRLPAAPHGVGHDRDAQRHGLQGTRQSGGLPAQKAGAARSREGFLAERALGFLGLGVAGGAAEAGSDEASATAVTGTAGAAGAGAAL